MTVGEDPDWTVMCSLVCCSHIISLAKNERLTSSHLSASASTCKNKAYHNVEVDIFKATWLAVRLASPSPRLERGAFWRERSSMTISSVSAREDDFRLIHLSDFKILKHRIFGYLLASAIILNLKKNQPQIHNIKPHVRLKHKNQNKSSKTSK